MKTLMEENELIQQLRLGNDDAFDAIFRLYFVRLCLFAEHYLKRTETAEEIVEDFLCHFWDNCQTLSINVSLRAYLFRGVHNRCLNYLRNQKVREQYIAESKYYFLDEELLGATSAESSNSEFITWELEKSIELAIHALPEQCRIIFCLNRFDNLTYSQIGKKLGISKNTVKTQMTRALCKLRESLKDYLVNLSFIILIRNIIL